MSAILKFFFIEYQILRLGKCFQVKDDLLDSTIMYLIYVCVFILNVNMPTSIFYIRWRRPFWNCAKIGIFHGWIRVDFFIWFDRYTMNIFLMKYHPHIFFDLRSFIYQPTLLSVPDSYFMK